MGSSVIIIGAGLSGLSTAAFLESSSLSVTLFEASPVPGGLLQTHREDGRIIDLGANGWLDGEPAMQRLLDQLGLREHLISSDSQLSRRWIFAANQLHRIPGSPSELLSSQLLPFWAKLRLMFEPLVGRAAKGTEESIGDFVRRRCGQQVFERLVYPLISLFHAGDPNELSAQAAFPALVELETQHRSLLLALLKRYQQGRRPRQLQTLPNGTGGLTRALAQRLAPSLHCGARVTAIEQRHDQWLIHTTRNETASADAVVLTCPAPAQSSILCGLDPALAKLVGEIEYTPVSLVCSAAPAGAWDRSPEGYGVHLTRAERVRHGGVLSTIFASCIFPSQGLNGETLLRTLVQTPSAESGADPKQLARQAHGSFFGAERAAPTMSRLVRHPYVFPRYDLGHAQRIRGIRTAQDRWPGLFFSGRHINGISITTRVRQAEQLAATLSAFLT